MSRSLRRSLVALTVKSLRRRHRELRTTLTSRGIRRVLKREGVEVLVLPLSYPAKVVGFMGTPWVILSDRVVTERAKVWALLHELAHVKLHLHDQRLMKARGDELTAGVRSLDDWFEAEANLLARLLGAPTMTPAECYALDPAEVPA